MKCFEKKEDNGRDILSVEEWRYFSKTSHDALFGIRQRKMTIISH